jgi:hypothetical protein
MYTAKSAILLISGVTFGVLATIGFNQSRAQAPAGATSTRPAVFVITEQRP